MDDRSEAARIVDRNQAASPLEGHPQLRRYVECFLETFLLNGKVDPRLRELVILRIAWRCGQPYEWAQHYRRARQLEITDAEVLSVRVADPEEDLGDPLRLLVRAADEVVDQGRIAPVTYERCGEFFADPGVLHEFLHLVAGYRMMATVLNTTRPALGDKLALWPPDGVGPEVPSA
jgi:alkylhydroperoxidase family enzyme